MIVKRTAETHAEFEDSVNLISVHVEPAKIDDAEITITTCGGSITLTIEEVETVFAEADRYRALTAQEAA